MTAADILKSKITASVIAAVADPDVPASGAAAAPIAEAVIAGIAPEIIHATNGEPWYRSRVTLGALLAAVSGVAGIFGYALPSELQGQVIDAVLAVASLVSALVVLYGRWVAKAPIGTVK